ncbi:MAG: S1 RNA-binding domain-containing protein, partial [Turicibacter sp.]
VVGFLPMNQITEKRISRVEDALSIGQDVDVKVVRFEPNNFKLELSIRRIKEDAEREEFNKYMQQQETVENETLGDLFGDALKNLL